MLKSKQQEAVNTVKNKQYKNILIPHQMTTF